MAFLPSVKSVSRADIGPDAPPWIDNLLTPLTIFMESVYSAFNKNITLQENIACSIRDFVVETRSDYNSGGWTSILFPSGLRTKPIGVILLQITDSAGDTITDPVSLVWRDLSGTIEIQYISGLANSKKYNARFLIC